ncbi:MAG: PEP-CTERM system TPR-repeat protein PrsT [Chromatium okenii]|nr:PEP-CTERM system TPR-repeat protein PrsT [Chromatium okenii]
MIKKSIETLRYGVIAVALTTLISGCSAEESLGQQLARGEAALMHGELKTALIELKNVLQKDSQNQRARLLLGQAYLQAGDAAAAEQELQKAQKLGAKDSDLQPWLMQTWLQQGKLDQVTALAIPETIAPPLRAQLLAIQADALQSGNNLAGAQEKAALALKVDPEAVAARLVLARLRAATNQFDAARQLVNEALQRQPQNAAALNLLGDIERAAGQWAAADAAYTKAIADPIVGRQAHLNRAIVRIQANQLDAAAQDIAQLRQQLKKNPQLDYVEGLLLYTKKDYAHAIEYLQAALGAAPDFLPALTLAGATRLALGEPALARIHLERASAAQPDDQTIRRLLATALLQQGDAKEAERLARSILQRQPNDTATMDLLANTLMIQGKRDESISYLRQVKAEMPDSAAANARLGAALLSDGDAQEGLRALQAALNQDPTFQGAAEQLVLGAISSNKLDQALEAAKAYQTREPGSARAQTLLGMVYLQRKELDAATKAFNKALELEPGDLTASGALAALALQNKNLDQAKGYLTASLKHHPDSAQLLIMLAKIALAQNDAVAAKTYLDTAQQRNPKALEPQIYLAAYYLQRGEPAQAIEIVNKALLAFPKNAALLGVLADAQVASRQFTVAQTTLNTLRSLTPDEPKIHVAQGIVAAGLGDLAQAKRELEQALALDPKFAPAINLLARLAIAEKNVAVAQRRLQELKNQLGSSNPDVLLLEGQLAQLTGNSSAANDAFQELMTVKGTSFDSDPALWGAAEQLVLGHLRNKQPEAAVQAALDLCQRQPKSARAQLLLGLLYLQDKKIDDATQALRKTLELEPGNVGAANGLAAIALQTKDFAGAKTFYENSLKRNPRNVELLVNLARLALMQNDPPAAENYLERAAELNPQLLQPKLYLAAYHLKQGNAEQAWRVLSAAQRDNPNDVNLLGLMAESELALQRYAEAKQTLQQLATLTPKDPKVLVATAQAELGLEQPDAAKKALERALEMDSKSTAALIGLTRLAIAQKSPTQAQVRLDALSTLVGAENADVLLLTGNLAESKNDWRSARTAYQKLFDQTPSTVSLIWLTRALAKLDDVAGARQLMTEWVAQHPKDGLVHFQLAQVEMTAGHNDQAITHFQRTLETNPKNAVAMNNLAWLLQDRDPAQALKYAQQAFAAAPKSAEIVDTLAMVLLRNGQIRDALRTIDKALALSADNGSLLFHKAQILQKSGDRAQAQQVLETALQSTQTFAERSEAEALLKLLRGN